MYNNDDVFYPAVDAHVHLMPDRLLLAIQRVLKEQSGWSFDHPTAQDNIEERLRNQGVERYFALPYAHKSGIAKDLNDWVIERSNESEMAVPFATVHGEDDVEDVVREAFEKGAKGLKFQCPVQECGPADPRLDPAFELASKYDKPIIFHAGTAPFYRDSPHVGPDQFAQFIESYPDVRACAAHLGTFEFEEFFEFARDNDQVFLDTTMALSPQTSKYLSFDPDEVQTQLLEELSGSIMYGSDYPNLPYPYEEERDGLLSRDLSQKAYRDIFYRTSLLFLEG